MHLPFQKDLSLPASSEDHYRGNLSSDVRIVLYVDFANPDFIALHGQLNEILEKWGDKVLVVYRHFPQTLRHPQAYAAAQAIEAAAKQDKFIEMVGQVLANQTRLTDGYLGQYARAIGLDKARFSDDFSSKDVIKSIKDDLQSGTDSNVDTTPAIFVNGLRQSTLSMRFINELIESGGDVSG